MNVELSKRDKNTENQERREGIKERRYNRKFWSIWGEKVQKNYDEI
jgi:hypothetical protein